MVYAKKYFGVLRVKRQSYLLGCEPFILQGEWK